MAAVAAAAVAAPYPFPVFSLTELGVQTAAELDSVLQHLLRSPGWTDIATSSARATRQIDHWAYPPGSYESGRADDAVPAHLHFLVPLVRHLLALIAQSDPDIIPLQVFLCLYKDGQDSCPPHAHACRQLTLSLGSPRALTVYVAGASGRQRAVSVPMHHGDVVILNEERHAVLPTDEPAGGPRVSLNLFFTTRADATVKRVGVNARKKSRGGNGPMQAKTTTTKKK